MNSVLFAAIRSRKPIWLPRDHWNVWITMCQAFRKLTVRGFPCQHSYIINLSLSAHYSRPIALRGKQGAAIQVRLLVSTRKSCRETLMVKKKIKNTHFLSLIPFCWKASSSSKHWALAMEGFSKLRKGSPVSYPVLVSPGSETGWRTLTRKSQFGFYLSESQH